MIRLHTLGGLDLRAAGNKGHPLLSQPKRLGLLVYLAAANVRGYRRRDSVFPMFWPELDDVRARGALRQAVYVLRRNLGDCVIRDRGEDELGVDPAEVWLDVTEFEKALAAGETRMAADLYRGEFLDGFFVAGTGAEFDEWMSAERNRVRALASKAMCAVAEDVAGLEPDSAAAWVRRAVALAPDDELTVRRALALLEHIGDRAGALQLYHEFRERVKREYDAEPATETKAIAESLRLSHEPLPAKGGDAIRTFNAPTQHAEVSAPVPVEATVTIDAARTAPLRRRLRPWPIIGASVLATALIVWAWTATDTTGNSLLATGQLIATDDVLVGDIQAQPQDSSVAHALTELLRTAVGDTRTVRVVSTPEIKASLQRMELSVDTRLDASVARALAVRSGYEATLTTDLTPVGQGYVLSAHLMSARGTELATTSESASSQNDLIAAIGRLSKTLRSRIGESRNSLVAVRPLEHVTTQSLRALERYTEGQDSSDASKGVGSEPPVSMRLWREAIRIDSTFAIAHRRLGVALNNLGLTKEALRELRTAERFSNKLTAIERLAVVQSLQGMLRNQAGAIAAANEILRLEPNMVWEKWARMQLMWQYRIAGQYELLEQEYRTRGPVGVNGPVFWCALLEYQGRGAEALDTARAFYGRYQDSTGSVPLRSARYNLGLHHALGFAYDSAMVHGSPPGPTDIRSQQLLSVSRFARGEIANAVVNQQSAPDKLDAESFSALAIMLNTGEQAMARTHLYAAMADTGYRNRDPANRPIRPILALSLVGRAQQARRELSAIERASNPDVLIARTTDLNLAQGALALAENQPRRAIAAFSRAMTTMDLASVDACRVCALPWLGRAYDAAGMRDSATVIYERFLSTGDPNRYVADALWRASILQRLGALHAERGDTAAATLRLTEFVKLWKNADTTLQPRVEAARQRLVELEHASNRIGAQSKVASF